MAAMTKAQKKARRELNDYINNVDLETLNDCEAHRLIRQWRQATADVPVTEDMFGDLPDQEFVAYKRDLRYSATLF